VPGLYAAGDMACVPHNYLLGALTYGKLCAQHALDYIANVGESTALDDQNAQIAAESERIFAPLSRPNGIPHHQYEYKVRRLVNDYLQPPKSSHRLQAGLNFFMRASEELNEVGAHTPHDLMRVMEGHFIRDCAEMAARASMYRTESRWGLYHYRQDYPQLDNERWFVHVNLKQDEHGAMAMLERPIEPYIVPLDAAELREYHNLRIAPAPERSEWRREQAQERGLHA
jgi:succinate dehydrogenase/fumarate reductase flavoprotein subunit